MNWSDLLVIAIIVGFGFIGMANGFLLSMFKIASFFISIFFAVKLYPYVAQFLMKTALYANIKASILKNLLSQQQAQMVQVKQNAANAVMDSLHLPGFMKSLMLNWSPDLSKMVDLSKIMDTISGELAKMVIDVISLVVLYVLIRAGLFFLKYIIKGIAKLPVFKQMDKVGGFAFGAVEGLLTVYVVFALLLLFQAQPKFAGFFEAVNHSAFAKFFYQNNFIISWMFHR